MHELTATTDESLRRLLNLIHRVNSSTDTAQVLQEIADGVVRHLGFGLAAIARVDGDVLAVQAYAGPAELRDQLLGRRTPKEAIVAQFRLADAWGILRYVPRHRADADFLENAWIPDYVPDDSPDAWHPHDALYAPLYSATGDFIGNMAVDFPPGNRIPNQELRELLEFFVVQAGLALSNAQQRERLAEQVHFAEVVKAVAFSSGPGGLERTLRHSALVLKEGFGAAQVYLQCFPDPTSGCERRSTGHPSGAVRDLPDLRFSSSLHAVEAQVVHLDLDSPSGVFAPHVSALKALLHEHGAVGAVLSPISVAEEQLGHILILRDVSDPLTPVGILALREISGELGRIIMNARLFDRETLLVAELQELDRYKGELIATISHELKTPLTSIIGHSEMLAETMKSSRSITTIVRNAKRLDQLISTLLDYSRVQSKREQVRVPVDLAALAQNSLDLLAFQAERAGVRCSLHVHEPDVVVDGVADELGRVLDNLVGNAIKYSREGGQVSVSVSRRSDSAEVTVTDNGLGISASDQARLFSAFNRSSNPEALSIPGTGLGLAISRRIAEMHFGQIELESTLGTGSTFRLVLPRVVGATGTNTS